RDVTSGFSVDVFDDVAGAHTRLIGGRTLHRGHHIQERRVLGKLSANPDTITFVVAAVILDLIRSQVSGIRIQTIGKTAQRATADLFHIWLINVIVLNVLKNTLEDFLLRTRIVGRLL